MKAFHDQLEGVEVKMQSKISEIGNLTTANQKLLKQIEELRGIIQRQKKAEQQELADQQLKARDKDAEIEVLKEMIKGTKI